MLRPSRQHRKAFLAAILAVFGVFTLAVAGRALAQAPTANFGIEYGAYTGLVGTDIRITIANIIRVALGILGTIALLIVLYAGFLWMTAAGNEEQIDKAKKTMTGGVIGLLIIVSAFAIVSFVLNGLIAATGGGGAQFVGGGGGGGGLGGAGAGFRPTAIQPSGTLGKRDVVVTLTFSSAPTGDVSNIKANVLLEKVAAGVRTPTDYTPTVERNSIHLTPTTPCPAPNGTRFCLDADSNYTVTVRSGLKNGAGTATVSCGFGALCSQNFKTGSKVVVTPPTARITTPTDGQSVPAGNFVQVQTLLTDQSGIGGVDYLADGAFFGSDGSAVSVAPGNYTSQISWDDSAVTPVKTVSLTAEVTNIDGDKATSPAASVVVRPAHCFNKVKDADEVGVDCGGADCGSCPGSSCTSNAQCASGQCVNGQCVQNPEITDVQLRDGAPGNLVTISGLNFGSTPGKVVFLGGSSTDAKQAPLADCVGAWGNSQIIVKVPAGAVSGPIEVDTAAGKKDATNDNFGPIIPDFQVNTTTRPGICSITPTAAKPRDTITASGVAFGDVQGASRVEFVPADANCSAILPEAPVDAGIVSPWSATSIQPSVPAVPTGTNGSNYLLRAVVGGEKSNPACMLVVPPSTGTLPRIDFLSPVMGSPGTYVTLSGDNFGASGKVKFVLGGQLAYGDTTFPQQCSGGFWTNTNVIVKVPAKFTIPANTPLALGGYNVSILRSDGVESNAKAFTVNTDPVPPGVCSIVPNNGPASLGVSLYGERFGDVDPANLPALLASHPDSVSFYNGKNITSLSRWTSGAITTPVPSGASTGPADIRVYSGQNFLQSNGINFQVKDCRQSGGDAACAAGQNCCDDGSCRPQGQCVVANSGAFAWQFSTGPIPIYPVVIEDATCQVTQPTKLPSPDPFKGAVDICPDIGEIAIRFSQSMDVNTVNSTNVILQSCGTGASISQSCASVNPAPILGLSDYSPGTSNMLTMTLNNGLTGGTWYKVTLKSNNVSALMSLAGNGVDSEPLDGDFDGKPYGDYVTTFSTNTTPCVLAGVSVQPSAGLITSPVPTKQGVVPKVPLPYTAFPLSARCVILQCKNRTPAWISSDTAKATVDPAGGLGACTTAATPVAETVPKPPIQIQATIEGKSDAGNLTINYADPRVVEYGPHDCDVACPNTLPYAKFNIPMATKGSGSVLSTTPYLVHLKRCKNQSCLDFDSDVALSPAWDDQLNMLKLEYNGLLAASTYYRVVIDGAVQSDWGAPLTGLNFNNNSFSWTFRTRADASPCGPQKVDIQPPKSVLHYIGEVSKVSAQPRISPDACSATGQLLTDRSFNWAWSKQQTPPIDNSHPEAFTLLPYYPNNAPALLATNPILPAGCSTQCVSTGSYPPGTAVCGDGNLSEPGKECDTPGKNGCSDRCLLTGNANTGTGPGQCGNGVVEANQGEECDCGPNGENCFGHKNGDPLSGCTTNCKLTGPVPGLSVCGKESVGVGMACDLGPANGQPGSGCSSICLKTGADQNISVCGNDKLEAGEECDWTGGPNTATSLWVWKGKQKTQIPLDPKKDETDPRKPDFACIQSCLLRGNPVKCTANNQTGCCGDGIIDYSKGEGCDAGPSNGQPGSGCSSTCTLTGSDPVLRAFCGDATITQSLPANNIQNGGGEECEAPNLGNGYVDPTQVLTALNKCDASDPNNVCTGQVTAAVGTVSGQGSVSVQCSCQTDGDCTVFNAGLACGAAGCCYPRPQPPTIQPTGGNVCRNAQVTVDFQEPMDNGSLTGNILIVKQQPQDCTLPIAKAAPEHWLARAFGALKRFLGFFLGVDAAAAPNACPAVTGAFTPTTIVDVGGGKKFTRVTFTPSAAFDAASAYEVVVLGGAKGVKTANGVGYSDSKAATQLFTTGPDVCSFDVLQLTPAAELVQSSSKVYSFAAQPMTNHSGTLQPIAPIPNVYDWSLNWSMVQNPDNILKFRTCSISKHSCVIDADCGNGGGSCQTGDVKPAQNEPTGDVQAPAGKNGSAQVVALATILHNTIFQGGTDLGVGTQRVGKSNVTLMICENPWPARAVDGAWAPYLDPETHFKFFYCRDAAGGTLLPDLQQQPVQSKATFSPGLLRFCQYTTVGGQKVSCTGDADCGQQNDKCLSKDLLFQFVDPQIRDAIGVRVYDNPKRLSPDEWYKEQHFSGAPAKASADGFDAINDGRTIYASAPDKYGDPELRSYIYVLGYNDKAAPTTPAIFKQLIDNIFFNANLVPPDRVVNVCKTPPPNGDTIYQSLTNTPVTCSSDLDCYTAVAKPPVGGLYCDADKDKLRRDMRRWDGLFKISQALEDVRNNTGSYPKFDAGSFLRGLSTSKWPSWPSQLGAAGSVVDPLNAFNQCDKFGSLCTVTGKACASDAECDPKTPGDVCKPKFEAETCFNNKAGIFLCPAGSHVYRYTAVGGTDYRLNAEFEYQKYPWPSACQPINSQPDCESRPGCYWNVNACADRVSITQDCSGVPGGPNACLKNPNHPSCSVDSDCPAVQGQGDLCEPANARMFGSVVGAVCGDGIVDGSEECEIGQTNLVPCANGFIKQSCDNTCHWQTVTGCPGPAVCGNGSIEKGESCDDGAQTGQYNRCRSGATGIGCAKRCVRTIQRSSFNLALVDAGGDIGPACVSNADCAAGFVCTDRMFFCGDGVKNGPEACDDGPLNGQYDHCAWDCSGVGPHCGDGIVQSPEECDGNQVVSAGVCVPKGAACTKDADCGGQKCSNGFCTPVDSSTLPSADKPCTKTADCGDPNLVCDACGNTNTGLPQTRARSCGAPKTQNACKWADWSVCQASGACGDGIVDGAEECDAGSANSLTGACLPNCRKNVCGDGHVLAGVEQCDNGAMNGVRCVPGWGQTCSYCTTQCTTETVTGPYCGDGVIESPPESCDPGPIQAWCSRTLNVDPNTKKTTAKACHTDADCSLGTCKAYQIQTTAPPQPCTPAQGQQTCSPAYVCPAGYACMNGQTPANPCVKTNTCTKVQPTDSNTACHSAQDCPTPAEYCDGGDGQCIAYNTACTPEPYSYAPATGSADFGKTGDGSCKTCSNQCVQDLKRSPYFCGDSIVQPQYGEQCEGAGDPTAHGPNRGGNPAVNGYGTYYDCGSDCKYDKTSGFCGDNIIQQGRNEVCDGTAFAGGQTPSCSSQGWGTAGQVACGAACKLYGGGCSEGPLSPGDVRILVEWNNTIASNDLDTHMIAPDGTVDQNQAPIHNIGYAGDCTAGNADRCGSVTHDPRIWWAWDDTGQNLSGDIVTQGFPTPHDLEIMTMNWRDNGQYWSDDQGNNPYKLYIYSWSENNSFFKGARVTICTYQKDATTRRIVNGQPQDVVTNANCSKVYNGVDNNPEKSHWHVADFYGTTQDVPTIVDVDKYGNCGGGIVTRGGCNDNNIGL